MGKVLCTRRDILRPLTTLNPREAALAGEKILSTQRPKDSMGAKYYFAPSVQKIMIAPQVSKYDVYALPTLISVLFTHGTKTTISR